MRARILAFVVTFEEWPETREIRPLLKVSALLIFAVLSCRDRVSRGKLYLHWLFRTLARVFESPDSNKYKLSLWTFVVGGKIS